MPNLVSPIPSKYSCISADELPIVVVMPWKVRETLSPSFDALIPNSLRRSNSPVEASATASIICIISLPIAADVLPYERRARSDGSNPSALSLMKPSTD